MKRRTELLDRASFNLCSHTVCLSVISLWPYKPNAQTMQVEGTTLVSEGRAQKLIEPKTCRMCIDFYWVYIPFESFLLPVIVRSLKVLIVFCRNDEACFSVGPTVNFFSDALFVFQSGDCVLRKVPFDNVLLTDVIVLLGLVFFFWHLCNENLNFLVPWGLLEIFWAAGYKAEVALSLIFDSRWCSVITPCVRLFKTNGLLLASYL